MNELSSIAIKLKQIRKSLCMSRNEIERRYTIPVRSIIQWEMDSSNGINLAKLIKYMIILKENGFSFSLEDVLVEGNYLKTYQQVHENKWLDLNKYNTLGQRLKYIRIQANLSREYIYENHNIAISTIQKWEALSDLNIVLSNLVNYLNIYHNHGFYCSFDELILGEKKINSNQLSEFERMIKANLTAMQNDKKLLFCADLESKLIYAKPEFTELVLSHDSYNQIDNIYLTNLIAEIDKNFCLRSINQVLKGIKTIMRLTINEKFFDIELQPKFSSDGDVLGFTATIF